MFLLQNTRFQYVQVVSKRPWTMLNYGSRPRRQLQYDIDTVPVEFCSTLEWFQRFPIHQVRTVDVFVLLPFLRFVQFVYVFVRRGCQIDSRSLDGHPHNRSLSLASYIHHHHYHQTEGSSRPMKTCSVSREWVQWRHTFELM